MPKNKSKSLLDMKMATVIRYNNIQKTIIDAKLNKIQKNMDPAANEPIFPIDDENPNLPGNSNAQQNKPGDVQQGKKNNNKQNQKPTPSTNETKVVLQIPKQTKPNTPLVPNPNVITLVGNKRSKGANQQKKILKFQMQFQALQEKQRLAAKTTTTVTAKLASSHPNNTEINTGVQNSMGMPQVMEVPAPIPAPMQFLPPGQIQAYMPIPAPVPVQAPQASIQVPATDNVETVFSMDQDAYSLSDPSSEYTQQSFNAYQGERPNSSMDRYAFRCPTGIPKSFLRHQNNYTPTQPDSWPNYSPNVTNQTYDPNVTSTLSVQTDNQDDIEQPYSPSDIYQDMDISQGSNNDESKESNLSNKKRVSAFRRLGPQKPTKKPKLTISVTVNDNQEVREVVDETEEFEEITPVHLREDVILSTDETVMKYLKSWPWKRNVLIKKLVTARSSKTVMMLEKEQMEEIYEKDTVFVQVTINGYPPSWTKEQVLDMLMETMRGYSFIPCFIEFNREQCKFLTLRCRSALLCLHKCGFIIRKDDVELTLTLAQTGLTLNHIDFVPRLILRKRMHFCMEGETKLDLSAFTLKPDISHFIYFPLNRLYNQTELVQLQTEISWANLTYLNLSHNRITSLDGFELDQATPKLKHLDLSHNNLERITALLSIRNLPIKSIYLEGNPLCTDYTDPKDYVKVVKIMFPAVSSIDDVPIKLKGDMPKFIRNYCPENAKNVVEKFLDIYFPLLDGDVDHRMLLKDIYDDDAYITITYHYKLAFTSIYRHNKTMFESARNLEENILTMIKGPDAIINGIVSWPQTVHDPGSMTVDVLYHSDCTTILRVDGILKLGQAPIPDDQLLSFSRTVVLHTKNYVEYKIQSEMLYWGMLTSECAKSAFAVKVTPKLDLKIDSTTDESLQKELLKVFMELTSMDKNISVRCLEFKKWNLKEALDHFSNLLQLNSLDALMKDS